MKKLLAVLPLMLLVACNNNKYKVEDYTYAYQTSEVQEYTHDIYLAHCENGAYVEVPENYNKSYISLKKIDKVIYYYVYGVDEKVSNMGYEML